MISFGVQRLRIPLNLIENAIWNFKNDVYRLIKSYAEFSYISQRFYMHNINTDLKFKLL